MKQTETRIHPEGWRLVRASVVTPLGPVAYTSPDRPSLGRGVATAAFWASLPVLGGPGHHLTHVRGLAR